MSTLVVYFSRGGLTRIIAHAIAEQLQCTTTEITEPQSRKGFLGFFRSISEAKSRKIVKINPINVNLSDYDLIVVGTPVWAAAMASPIRAFLTQYGNDINSIAFFSTKRSSDMTKGFADMEQVCGKAPKAILDITMAEIQKKTYLEKLQAFIEKVQNN